MLFASHIFLLVFLPLTLTGYFLLNRFKTSMTAKSFLLVANLIFYGWFNFSYLLIMLSSIVINFIVGRILYEQYRQSIRNVILLVGVLFNLGLLGYFKYADFFINSMNTMFQLDWPTLHILLPLGISFFTFQQLAYIVDVYRRTLAEKYSFVTFGLFVSFFPQLIAGPIVFPDEMMPQFDDDRNRKFNHANFSCGLWIFSIGLAKKLLLADYFAGWVDSGFGGDDELMLGEAWAAVLGYTFQIYFDFSGYCDMAMGLGKMFNITLPVNFDSPYKSADIRTFWQRWHITLGRFLSIFVYFPLGGSKKSKFRTLLNLLITFFISGLWHGAGWLFIIWGILHGVAMCIHRVWSKYLHCRMPRWCGQIVTFIFLMLAFIFFRSTDFRMVGRIYYGLVNFSSESVNSTFFEISRNALSFFIAASVIIFFGVNSIRLMETFKPTPLRALITAVLLLASILCMVRTAPFIYFNF